MPVHGKRQAPLPFPIVRIRRVDGMRDGSPVPPSGGRGSHGGCDQPPGIAPSADGALDAWGFRPLRPAGISPRARGGCFARCGGRPGALPPGPLRFFEKNRVKLLTLGFTTRLQTCCKSTGSAPQGGDLPPPYRLLLLTSAGPYPGRGGSSPAGMPAGSRHPHRWSRRRSYR